MLVLALAESPIQLVPDGTLLFHLFIIILMVVLLNATLLRPINRILEKRDRLTKGRLTEAQRTLMLVEQKLLDYEGRLRKARAEGYLLMEQERGLLSRDREEELAEVKAEIGRWLVSQKEQLTIDIDQVRANLKVNARRTALEIGRQILHRDIAAEDLPDSPQG